MVIVQRETWTSPNLTDFMGSITTWAHHVDLDLSCVILGPIFVRHLLLLPSIHLALALENGYFYCHNKLRSEPFLKSTIAGSRDTRLYTWWPKHASNCCENTQLQQRPWIVLVEGWDQQAGDRGETTDKRSSMYISVDTSTSLPGKRWCLNGNKSCLV